MQLSVAVEWDANWLGPATAKALSVLLQTAPVTEAVWLTLMPKNKTPVYSFALKKDTYAEAAFVKKKRKNKNQVSL